MEETTEKQSVGIREFRDNLASYLLGSTEPVTITRHGGVVGTFIPARRKRTEEEKAASDKLWDAWRVEMAEKGLDEDEIAKDIDLLLHGKGR